jgi:glutamate dehydrogenase
VKRFGAEIKTHKLGREMIAMLIASSMVNRMGPFFVLRADEDTGAGVAKIARAYSIVREIFATRLMWREVEGLDHAVQAEVQYDSVFQISRMVRRAVYWFLQRHPDGLEIEPTVKRLQPGVTRLLGALPDVLSGRSRSRFEADLRQFESLGLPAAVGRRIAGLNVMTQALDIVEVAVDGKLEVETVARLYFELGRGLRLDWIRDQIELLEVEGRWRAMARATLRETLAQEQRSLVEKVLTRAGRSDPYDTLVEWLRESKAQITRTQRALDDMRASGQLDFATLSVALKEIGRLV